MGKDMRGTNSLSEIHSAGVDRERKPIERSKLIFTPGWECFTRRFVLYVRENIGESFAWPASTWLRTSNNLVTHQPELENLRSFSYFSHTSVRRGKPIKRTSVIRQPLPRESSRRVVDRLFLCHPEEVTTCTYDHAKRRWSTPRLYTYVRR